VAQDSSQPGFWEERYRGGVTPWDAHGVPAALREWLPAQPRGLRVLVPGCGRGYEVRAFAEQGHDVLAIDFSDAAIEEARTRLGSLAGSVRKADFFALPEKDFDLVYERTFLCALPRRLWPQWAARLAELVRPGGRLAGFFFFDDNERGPPFGTSQETLDGLLAANFSREEDVAIPAGQSVAVLAGRERWQAWRRSL
jgi:SAM-dependent methyltransferase